MPKKAEIVKQEVTIQPYSLQQSILLVRGEQVMLDFQLAKLYGVETRVLKQAVNRNIERFPEDFMFRLTKDESNSLVYNGASQIVIPPNYLSTKYENPPKPKMNPVGYAATAARYEEEEKRKNNKE